MQQLKFKLHAEESARRAQDDACKEKQIILQECNQIHLPMKDTWKQLQSIGGSDECKTMLEEDLKTHISLKSKLTD